MTNAKQNQKDLFNETVVAVDFSSKRKKRTTSGANRPLELAKAARGLMRHTHIATGVTVDDLLAV